MLRLRPSGDGEDTFVADRGPRAFPRLYGGTLVGQAVAAAASCTDDRFEVVAVHARYGHAGDLAAPIAYRVERHRDTRTLAARVSVSFHDPVATGVPELVHEMAGQAAPDPGTLPTRAERPAARFGPDVPAEAAPGWPVDTRYVDRAPRDRITPDTRRDPRNLLWLRASGTLPEVPPVHAAALGHAPDFPMFEPILFPHDVDWEHLTTGRPVDAASLDHTFWLHRPPRFDEWLLLDQVATVAGRARGSCRAELHTRDGELVATLAQEVGSVRPRG